MKKLAIILLAAFVFVGINQAQQKMSLGAGLLVSLPMGDWSDGANAGFGGTAAFEMEFMPQLVGVANAGYISWGSDVEDFSFSGIPVTFGVKYYFVPKVPFYGLAQLGLTFMSIDTPFEDELEAAGFESETSSTEFTFVIGAGYEVWLNPTTALDFTGALNVVSDANHISFRAGAKFAL